MRCQAVLWSRKSVQPLSQECSTSEPRVFRLWAKSVQPLSQECSTSEPRVFSLWAKSVQPLSQECSASEPRVFSLWAKSVQPLSQECSASEPRVFNLWAKSVQPLSPMHRTGIFVFVLTLLARYEENILWISILVPFLKNPCVRALQNRLRASSHPN